MALEIDIQKERDLFLRKFSLGAKEATVQRLCARFRDRREKGLLVFCAKSSNLDFASIL
ncbi:hypothetical protein D3C83_185300 [compost metagenome]